MALRFFVPGKTFLAGEYLALKKGPALVIATQPRFEILIQNGSGQLKGIHPESPAGLLFKENLYFFSQFDIEFIDPLLGRGGWGASTAQFLALYCLWRWQDACVLGTERYLDTQDLLKTYTRFAWNGQGLPPSGADLIAQYKGRISWFDRQLGLINEITWPFQDLEIILIQTGVKIATHEHLRLLTDFSSAQLETIMSEIKNALFHKQSAEFISGIRKYATELAQLGFVAESTLSLIHELSWLDGVQTVKGCGALGADVVLALVQKNQTRTLETWLKENQYSYMKMSENLAPGIQIKSEGPITMKTSEREVVL